ncbi:MAG: alpha/beta hydrolase [Firmicutes bacterium]|nr:alpha/beta hydrolase [Bacillota bacterium]
MDHLHFGKKGGEKYVILPGLSLKSVLPSAEVIMSAYSLLAKDRDIYLIEHIKGEPEGFSIYDMADDVIRAFGDLGIDKADVMGVSMGGMVAQALALKYPEKVSSLILCSTAARVDEEHASVFGNWRRLAEKRDAKGLGEAFGKAVYTPAFYEQYKDIIDSSSEGAVERDYEDFLVSIDAIENFDAYDDLEDIKCPVFVLGAGEDKVLGAKASPELMEKLRCSGYIYEGKGHGVYDEAPDYLQRIKDFLEEK